jgi:glycosyltransferase involved in cell wall biosynthesis
VKILHVITRLILGGAQQNTVMSCRAQVEAGHEVHLAYGPIHGPEGSLLDEAQASGATLHEVPPLVREISPRQDWACRDMLTQLIETLRPDAVHTHSSKAGILGRAAAWRIKQTAARGVHPPGEPWHPQGPSVVHTVHGLPFHDQQSRLVHRLYVGLERYAARRCDHLIAITPAMVDAFVNHNIAPRKKFSVIPSGIDIDAFTARPHQREPIRRRLGIPPDAFVVGHVGRLDPLKGHADLLDQLPRLRDGGRAVWLLFVGDGFHRRTLETHAGIELGKTVITGLVPLAEVPDYLSAMDVMALPSYQEGQSRTLCEALLCGVPVVGYNVGGIPSVCIDGVTGRLVPVGDREALGDVLLALLDDPAERDRLATAGREHVIQNFSADKMNRELLALYDRLVSGETNDEAGPGSVSPGLNNWRQA